jgi:hypothetical protein
VIASLKDTKCPFNNITILNEDIGTPGSIERHLKKSINSWKLLYFAYKKSPNKIWVCRDGTPESRSLLSRCGKDCEGVYIEDGAGVYNSQTRTHITRWKLLFKKAIFGPWFYRPTVNGNSKEINKLAVTYPKLVRPEISGKETYEISPYFLQCYGKKWASQLLYECSIDCNSLKKIDDIFLPVKYRNPSQFPSDYISVCRRLVEKLARNRKIGVKYHPSEERGDYLDVSGLKNVQILPSYISSEFLFMYMENLRRVFSLASTSLLSARWIRADLEPISTAELLGHNDFNFLNSLKEASVEMLSPELLNE